MRIVPSERQSVNCPALVMIDLMFWILLLCPRLMMATPEVSTAPGPQASRHPDREAIQGEFDLVCRRLTSGDNIYFGSRILASASRKIEGSFPNPLAEFRWRDRFIHALVRHGEFERVKDESKRLVHSIDWLPDAMQTPARQTLLERLAISHYLAAEETNCLNNHNQTSCILPFASAALHRDRDDTRIAGDLYLRLLELEPGNARYRWMLNLSRRLSKDYPAGVPPPYRLPDEAFHEQPWFPALPNVASSLGVDAFDLAGGAIMEDFDGDGLLDLVSSTMDPCDGVKAFRNRGDGSFADVSRSWGLDVQLGGLNIVHADFDNDGRPDLLVLRGGWLGADGRIRNSLLRNDLNSSGRFIDVTAAAGIAFPAYPTQTAAWADFDGDGDLDLFVGNESQQTATVDPSSLYTRIADAYPSQLFRNNGDGTFTDITRTAGVANLRLAKGVAWGDYDDDGDPDLYVSNIGPNRLYRNNGNGTFDDVAPDLGVSRPASASFATWFFDLDNDGDLDLFVADYQARIDRVLASYLESSPGHDHVPLIFRNDGDGFTEVSKSLGLNRPLLPMGANFGDLDNDGWLDIALGTGTPDFAAVMPNVLYRNTINGFEDVTFSAGFGSLQKGHGIAFGDLDNDGDQDLFQQLGGAFPYDRYFNAVYLNQGNSNRWMTLILEGRKANRMGLGARITVTVREDGGHRTIHAVAGSGGSFGGSSLRQEIGLGDAEAIESLSILWPGSGTRDTYFEVPLNRAWRATEAAKVLQPVELPTVRFATTPGAVNGHHHEGP